MKTPQRRTPANLPKCLPQRINERQRPVPERAVLSIRDGHSGHIAEDQRLHMLAGPFAEQRAFVTMDQAHLEAGVLGKLLKINGILVVDKRLGETSGLRAAKQHRPAPDRNSAA